MLEGKTRYCTQTYFVNLVPPTCISFKLYHFSGCRFWDYLCLRCGVPYYFLSSQKKSLWFENAGKITMSKPSGRTKKFKTPPERLVKFRALFMNTACLSSLQQAVFQDTSKYVWLRCVTVNITITFDIVHHPECFEAQRFVNWIRFCHQM